MNSRERILAALSHEEPDRVPCGETSIDNLRIIQYYGGKYMVGNAARLLKLVSILSFRTTWFKIGTSTRRGMRFGLAKTVALAKAANLDFVLQPIGWLFTKAKILNYRSYVNEIGQIQEVARNPADGMVFFYYKGGYFHDFDAYERWGPLNPQAPVRRKAFQVAQQINQDNDSSPWVIPSLPGVLESSWQGFGLTTFAKMLRKGTGTQVLDDRGKFTLEIVKYLLDLGAEAFFMADDMGFKTDVIFPPKILREHVFPWYRQIAQVAHKAGAKFILHSCGNINTVLDEVVNTGIDALHPFEPTANMDIFAAKQKYGDRLTLIGNVSAQDLASQTPDEIFAYTQKLLTELKPGGGYILSSGHSINPAVTLENWLAMRDAHAKFSQYKS
jgi:hypothetical protein